MIIDYLEIYNKYKPIETFLQGKRRRQFKKLTEWLVMEHHRIDRYHCAIAGMEF